MLSTALLLSLAPLGTLAEEPVHFLDFSEDNFKIALISGNFTASVTRDIPRVVFLHTHAMLSPTFVFSTTKLYLFNDTDSNGLMNKSKVLYTGYLDLHHNEWNVSPLMFVNDTEAGEYALIRMHKLVSLYERLNDSGDPRVTDWANVTFQFRISERMENISNRYGDYFILGKTEMRINFTIDILKPVGTTFIAVEQELRGGGSTSTFLLKQSDAPAPDYQTQVLSREDDTIRLYNYSHRYDEVAGPMQEISYAKDDRTVQAVYRFSSAPMNSTREDAGLIPMNTSYYTTGTSMMLQQVFTAGNSSGIYQEMSLGLNEVGFIVKVRDWFERNLPMLMVVLGSITLVITVPLMIYLYRKHFWTKGNGGTEGGENQF